MALKCEAASSSSYLSPWIPPTHTHRLTPPRSTISIHLLACLMRTKKNLYGRLICSRKTDNHFSSFLSLMSVKGSGSTDWTDVESKVFGSVVSWLDEQMQTWLPLCESSLLTTVTKIQSEVFLPVYIQSRVLAAGTGIWTRNSTICFTKHPSVVLFWLNAFY